MEHNKGRRTLAKPARAALIAIEELVARTMEESRAPDDDEFFAQDFRDALFIGGVRITVAAATKRLIVLCDGGEYTSRLYTAKGTKTRVFKKKKLPKVPS